MKDSPVSIRFSTPVSLRLDDIARATGIPKAEIVRRATVDYLDKVVAEGRMVIPLMAAEKVPPIVMPAVNSGAAQTRYKISRKK